MSARFKVYDKVWVMNNGKPSELMVFAVVESMNYWKNGTEFTYNLVGGIFGAGWGNNSGVEYGEKHVFSTKEDLIKSL